MDVVVAVVALVVVLATYVTWTAQRLDRLHARVDASAATLDAQLVRRAAAAAAFAANVELPERLRRDLAVAAHDAAVGEGLGHDREMLENALSRALHALPAVAPVVLDGDEPLAAELRSAATKTAFARRFHNDAVRDTLVVRRRRVPRLLRLAGSAPAPAYFEIDDTALPSPGGASGLG